MCHSDVRGVHAHPYVSTTPRRRVVKMLMEEEIMILEIDHEPDGVVEDAVDDNAVHRVE